MNRAGGRPSTQTIAVVGAGPVGLAFALAASRQRDVAVTVFERATNETMHAALNMRSEESSFDHRVYALSPKSLSFLAQNGVVAGRSSPIRRMQIVGEPANRVDSALPETTLAHPLPLAHVVEHRELQRALWGAVQTRSSGDGSDIELHFGAEVTGIEAQASGGAVLGLNDQRLAFDLIVGADGRGSKVRSLLGIEAEAHDYRSDALIANFECEYPHAGAAYQWFSGDGVLAYLPLPGNRISIVWSVPHERALALGALSDAGFAAAVAEAGHHVLGALQCISQREAVPLKRVLAASWSRDSAALIGDAAHAVHPLAGQGMNLGFGDAECLAAHLVSRGRLNGVGDVALLARYQRSRIGHALAVSHLTHALSGLYPSPSRLASVVQQHGFAVFDRLGAVKSRMVEYAVQH